jgi:hypothetical protein
VVPRRRLRRAQGSPAPPASKPALPAGAATLVIDQCSPGESGCVGRASYPRLHLYCQPTTQSNPWMCISTSML